MSSSRSRWRSIVMWIAAAIAAACTSTEPAAPTLHPAPGGVASKSGVPTSGPGATIVISELMPDPKGTDATYEWFELYNAADTAVNLRNFQIGSANDADFTVASDVIVQPTNFALFVRTSSGPPSPSDDVPRYVYPSAFTLNNSNTDWLVIRSPSGVEIDSVAYAVRTNGTPGSYTPPTGASREKRMLVIDCSTLADNGAWGTATTVTSTDNDKGTPGLPNDVSDYTYTGSCGGSTQPGGPVASVTVTPSPASVVLNKTATLTATARDANNTVVTTTYTWSSSDPDAVSVNASGVVTGKESNGSATITATAANGVAGSTTVSVTQPASSVTVSGRSAPLPIGFQTQLFASGTDGSGNPVSTVTWSTSDPSVVTVDSHGVITAAGNGSAKITATAPDGTAGSTTISTEVGLLAGGARSGHNTELGVPVDNDPSNDVLIVRKQYTISYNPQRGGPNWVSWNLDASHLGSLDRCDCFSEDTALVRLGAPAYTTNDFITGGLYDRGHMEPSADQTTTDYENAYTFFLSNVLPQEHDLNAGPWEDLENALRDSARAGREVYTIAGGVFTNGVGLGTLNGLGKIAIPDSTWKIAVLMPAGDGLSDVTSPSSVTVVAVNMPNISGIASTSWQQYTTTVAKIEASTGYNFLNLIPENIQCKLEVRNCLPVPVLASANGSSTVAAGTQLVVNTSAADADGADGPWKLVIDWGDGTSFSSTLYALPTSARPFARAKSWTTPGTYTVRLTVTDKKGGQGIATFPVTVTP